LNSRSIRPVGVFFHIYLSSLSVVDLFPKRDDSCFLPPWFTSTVTNLPPTKTTDMRFFFVDRFYDPFHFSLTLLSSLFSARLFFPKAATLDAECQASFSFYA